ncbi:hypothetical protein [Pseudomonas putida]|uniref:hypothetical protein n=1 Tax=Pseudomonas putida TaxID=303 RepID=UPI0011CEBB72|nr:hypothetical protein [Pseudomonas putida]
MNGIQPRVPEGSGVGPKKPEVSNSRTSSGRPAEGQYTKQIGSGENARNSFIYITILWSFIIGSVTCGAIYIRTFAPPDMSAQEIVEAMRGVWSIFLPIITLALGYAFGKGKK